MLKYFKDLLLTLKSIDASLSEVRQCIRSNSEGSRKYLNTKSNY